MNFLIYILSLKDNSSKKTINLPFSERYIPSSHLNKYSTTVAAIGLWHVVNGWELQ